MDGYTVPMTNDMLVLVNDVYAVERRWPCCIGCGFQFMCPDSHGLRGPNVVPIDLSCDNCGLTSTARFWVSQQPFV